MRNRALPILAYQSLMQWVSVTEGVTHVGSHGVLSAPFSGGGLVLWSVGLVDVGDLWDKWIIWVGITQQGADGEEDLGDGECW